MMHDTPFVEMSVNPLGRDFLVGDLHGRLDMLWSLLAAAGFSRFRDRVIALGDMIDRGAQGEELLDMVDRLAWFHAVRGNHEAALAATPQDWFDSRSDEKERAWAQNLSFGRMLELAEIIRGMPLAIELPLPSKEAVVGLVHAEVPLGLPWPMVRNVEVGIKDVLGVVNSTASSLLCGRRRFYSWAVDRGRVKPVAGFEIGEWSEPIVGIDAVFCGHTVTPSREPLALGGNIYLDTGPFLPDGRLTLLEPETGRYWQAVSTDAGPRVVVHAEKLGDRHRG